MQIIHDFIRSYSNHSPSAIALAAPGRKFLDYQGLNNQVEYVMQVLNSSGFGTHDNIAIVLPEGPEMSAAFLTVICSATAVPLNPAYQIQEFEYYFVDLEIDALITMPEIYENAVLAANKLNIPILALHFDSNQPAGCFQLTSNTNLPPKHTGFASPDDLALITHTSGSTSRPKIVPLTHQNITISAKNITNSLQLSPADRCMNVMPVFHIHGSCICLFSSLLAGGSVVACPGFIAPKFLDWLTEFQPTWYSAAPTIHQSVYEQAVKAPQKVSQHSLRLVRSSAAAMPTSLIVKMEDVFKVPFIEGYGLSESAHLLASNFLPPFVRKLGSVGIAAGPEVAIMQQDLNELLPPGQTGEIVTRGPNLMSGYLKNPEANREAFCNGWFRTGDQAYQDEEGYFYITGRIKEIINRGGEKIAPREIEEALLQHPAVVEAVSFGMPDPRLGEEVTAAVVLQDSSITENTIKHFLSSRLAYNKVPRRILLVDEIPKSPTGKMQRTHLAEYWDINAEEEVTSQIYEQPETEIEKDIAALWSNILLIPEVKRNQSFVSLGGDSILAGSLLIALQEKFGVRISFIDLFDAPTVADQANLIQKVIHSNEHNP